MAEKYPERYPNVMGTKVLLTIPGAVGGAVLIYLLFGTWVVWAALIVWTLATLVIVFSHHYDDIARYGRGWVVLVAALGILRCVYEMWSISRPGALAAVTIYTTLALCSSYRLRRLVLGDSTR